MQPFNTERCLESVFVNGHITNFLKCHLGFLPYVFKIAKRHKTSPVRSCQENNLLRHSENSHHMSLP